MPFLVSASDPFDGTLIPLERGGFVRLHLTGQHITLDRLDALGETTTSSVPVSTTPAGRSTSSVGALSLQDGSVGVWWVQHDAAMDNDRLLFKQIAQDGTLGPAQVVATANTTAHVLYDNVHAALLTNGQVVLSADRVAPGSGSTSYLTYTTRFTPGEATGADLTTVVSRDSESEVSTGLVALADGGYVVTYATMTPVPGKYALYSESDLQWNAINSYGRVYDNGGNPGTLVALGTSYFPDGAASGELADLKNKTGVVVATDDGGFAVVGASSHLAFNYRGNFSDHYQNVGDGVTIGVYDATGHLRNTIDAPSAFEFAVPTDTTDGYGHAVRDVGDLTGIDVELIGLKASNSAFLLVGQRDTSSDVTYAFANASGSALDAPHELTGSVFALRNRVIDPLDGLQLPDGRIFLEGVGPNGEPAGQIFDPRGEGVHLTGTTADEIFVGTPFNDTLEGGGGNDTIAGGTGDDIVALASRLRGGIVDSSLLFSADGGKGTDTLDLTGLAYQAADTASLTGESTFYPNISLDLTSGVASYQFQTTVENPRGAFTVKSFESVVLAGGDNHVTGTAGANTIRAV